MTAAVSVQPTGGSPPWRILGAAAQVAISACGVAFILGLVLWARDDDLVAAQWALPDTWSEGGLRDVADEAGIPIELVSAYFMLLETLVATAGLVAAALLLRGARSWFRLYVAVALAVWVTLGGAMAVVYADAVRGPSGDVALTLQGLGWLAVFPAAYLFPDGRFVPGWTRWAVLAWPTYYLVFLTLPLLGYQSNPDGLIETLPLLVLFGTALFAAVLRYRKVSTPEQRLQTRGVVAALAIWFVVALVSIGTPVRGLRAEETVPGLVANGVLLLAGYLAVALLPGGDRRLRAEVSPLRGGRLGQPGVRLRHAHRGRRAHLRRARRPRRPGLGRQRPRCPARRHGRDRRGPPPVAGARPALG